MNKKDLIKKLEKSIDNGNKTIKELGDSDNPQVKIVRERVTSRIDAFEAVLSAMKGNSTLLNIYAE